MQFFKSNGGTGGERLQRYSAIAALDDDDSEVNLTHEYKDEDSLCEIKELRKSLWKTKMLLWSTLGLALPCLVLVFLLLAINVVKVQTLAPKQLLMTPVPPSTFATGMSGLKSAQANICSTDNDVHIPRGSCLFCSSFK